MSVQAGIWNFDGKAVDTNLVADFSASLRQQGPDDESSWTDGAIALLYRPFHTTAESRREKQPYVSRRGFVVTWDGWLGNRDELALEFRSYLDSSPTDVALVATAFDHWDTDCFRRIIGDWAMSIWKPASRELLFAVDYMAIRHIFYYSTTDRVFWSTDIAPLVLLSGDTFHIDENYIAGYFAHDPDAYLTPYKEIREVRPGHFVSIRDRHTRVERHWRFKPKARIRYKTDAEYEEHFRHVFRQSVRRRLRSDSPILAELSGGLDSSSIVCMADDIIAKEGAQTPRLDTLSYYDKTEPNGDDWIYFQKVELHRGKLGNHIDGSKLGSVPASLQLAEFDALPGYLGFSRHLEAERAQIVREGDYRTVLSGIGGDEFLGGIPNPSAQLADSIVQLKLMTLARQLMAWSLVKRRPLMHLLWSAVLELLPPSVARHFAKQAAIEPWIDRKFAKKTGLANLLINVDEPTGFWLPTRRSCAAGVILMANKLSKWASPTLQLEEARYPYLDQDLIEFILSIPATQMLRPGQRRSLMRRSLAGLVPDEILSRKTKQFGSRTPVICVEKHLDQVQEAFETPLSSRLGYIDKNVFLERLHAARNGAEIHISRMIRTISLELWLRDLESRRLLAHAFPAAVPLSAEPLEVSA